MSRKRKKLTKLLGSPAEVVRKEPLSVVANQRKDDSLPSGDGGSRGMLSRPAKRRRWLRRLLWICVIFLTVIVVLRVLLWVSLPWFLDKAMGDYGLHCTYERLNLSLLTGDAELWHLVLSPAEKDDPLAHVEYCRAEVSLTTLLARRLVVPRIEVDGMDVNMTRAADGRFPQLQQVLKALEAKKSGAISTDVQTEVEPATQGEIDLTPPIKLDALRLQHAQVNFRDESVSPVLETRLDMNVRLSDLGSAKRQTRFQITVSSPPVLDQFIVEGTGSSLGMDLLADVKIALNGLHLPALRDYLGSLGITPEAENIALTCSGQIRTQGIAGIVAEDSGLPADAMKSTAESETPLVPRTLNVHMNLGDVAVTADGQESFTLGHVAIDANLPRSHSINLANINVAQGRAHLWKRADNALSIAGVKLAGESNQGRQAGVDVPTSGGPATPVEQTGSVAKDTSTLEWSVGALSFNDLRLVFHDESISPKTDLALLVRTLAVDGTQPKETLHPGQLAVLADLSVPGVVETIGLKGTVEPSSPEKKVAFRLSSSGIRPDSLAPYLEALGLRSLHENGEFVCDVNASYASQGDGLPTIDVSIADIGFKDKEGELLGLETVALRGAHFDPSSQTARIEAVDIAGQRLALGRDRTGCFTILGFQLVDSRGPRQSDDVTGDARSEQLGQADAGAAKEIIAVPKEAEAAEIRSSLPRIEIGRFSWQDSQVTFTDQAISPAKSIAVPDFGCELKNLVLDFSGNPVSPASLSAWLDAPGIVARAALSGSLSTKQAGLSLNLKLSCEGLTAAEVAPYLQSLGIGSAVTDGDFQAELTADLAWAEEPMDCSVTIHDVALADGQAQLAGLKRLQVDRLRLQDVGLAVDGIAIDQPYLTASRDSSGALNLAGVRLLPRQEGKPGTASPAAPTPEIRISRFNIADAQLHWSDQAVQPAVSQALRANVTLTDIGLGFDAPPSAVNIAFAAPGAIKSADVSGTLRLTPSEQGANLKIEASGIQMESLTPYFSAGPRPALRDASFRGQVEARLAKHPDGGYQASLALGNIDYHDGDKELPLLKLDSAKAILSRVDPNAQVISIEELSVHGLQASGQRRTTDVLSVLGFELGSASSGGSAAEPNNAANGSAASSTKGKTATAANIQDQGQDKTEKVGSKSSRHPLITLKTLDVQLREFTLTDRTRPTPSSITLSDWRMQNTQPIELLGGNPDANPIVKIDVTGKFLPFTESVTLNTELSPFAAQPRIQAQWDVEKIDASELGSVLPELTTVVDPNSLKNGQLSGTAELTLNLERRDVLDFDLGKPFGLTLLLKDVQLTDADKKVTLAGFEELRADIPKLDLAKNSIRVKEIGLTKPQGTVSKENDGLHVLGLVLKTPAEEDATDANSPKPAQLLSDKSDGSEQSDVLGAARPDGPSVQGPDVRIDQILVNGIDFTFVDRTTDPAVPVPLAGMDVEVRNFATRAAGLTDPVRFNVILAAGQVPLPTEAKKSHPESDDAARSDRSDGRAPTATEQRLLFQEMTATGQVALYPKLDGWVKAGFTGLELVNFKGAADRVGVILNNGVLDTSIDLRFRKDGELSTRTQIVFTDLSLTEPPDGFLRKLLSLPTSLDTVLFILQDADGAIRLPLTFEVKEEGLSGGQIAGIAIGATATLIANAVANSPFRIAGTVGDIVGVGAEETDSALETYMLQYAPGVTVVSDEHQQTLERLLSRLRKDKELTATIRHQLGVGDVMRADALVNPSPTDASQLLTQLKLDNALLRTRRDRLASETRAAYAAGYYAEAWQKTQRLQQTERYLGLVERALDDLLEMMRPGAEHAAKRRTRDACLAIGKARLDAIAGVLSAKNAADIQDRIKFVQPGSTVAQDNQEGSVKITLSASKAR